MFKASDGGGAAARVGALPRAGVYRHSLVRLISTLLGPLPAGGGWSMLAVALAGLLMSWDAGPTLAQRFESVLGVLDRALPRRRRTGRTYQGFIKALASHAGVLHATLVPRLRERTKLAAGACWRFGRWAVLGVDGSMVDAPRTVANEALGTAGRDKSGPQMTLLLLVHLGAMLPWSFRIGGARDAERTLLRDALDDLPEAALLVADAGFTGFDLLCELRRRGISFLVRVGSGVHLLRGLGGVEAYRREGKSIVHLWPEAHRGRPPLTLRLIRVGSAWLITDVADPRELSAAMAAELYRRRWGLEVAFRSLKQTLERRKVRSGSPARARLELTWAVLGLWVLTLIGARALAAAGQNPRNLSVARTLAALRHAMHAAPGGRTRDRAGPSDRALAQRLRACVVDRAPRRAPKTAYRWPHRKNPPQPGPPRITAATRAQVQAAARLINQNHPA